MLADLCPLLKRLRWIPERGSEGRRCGKCRLVKNVRNEFNHNKGVASSWCKICENEYKRDKYNSRRMR